MNHPDVIVEFTPNPNSVKILVRGVEIIAEGMLSFSEPEEAEPRGLAYDLLAVPGIQNVFLVPDFITITKAPDTEWNAVLPQIRSVLKTHF